MTIKGKMYFSWVNPYLRLARLHKPIGIFLLLWPTLWALWIAGQGRPDKKIVMVFILGVILMRSAGCVINDWADRHFDAHVARTQDRPLVTGEITPHQALWFFSLLSGCAFALVLTLNAFTILLAMGGLVLAMIYPFTKRFIHLPQLVLGVAFGGWPVLMVFAAQKNQLPPVAALLFLIAVLWPLAYDTMYAMVDREEDRVLELKSTALWWGHYDRAVIFALQVFILGLFLLLAWWQKFGLGFYFGWMVACSLAAYQQYLIKDRLPGNCFRAFLNNHWFGCALFLGIVAGYGSS
jgi:4-hydroxybenzoate polyprenyltransferase